MIHRHHRTIVLLIIGIGIGILITGAGSTASDSQDVFGLEFTLYQNHTVTDVDVTIAENESLTVPGSGDGPYRFTATDSEGHTVYLLNAVFSFSGSTVPADAMENSYMPVTVRLPYSPDITEITLSHEGETVHTFNTAATLCPPPVDRQIYHTYCERSDTGLISSLFSSPLQVVVIAVLLLLLAGIVVYVYRRKTDSENDRREQSERRNRRIQNNRDRRRRR